MALYRETATGFLCEYDSNPGAGYTAISAQPTDTVSNRVTWWRGLDTYGQTTAWHPSEYRSPQDPAEAALSIQFTREAAFISADASGTVTDAYLGANTEVRVYRGTSDVTASEGWVLTKVDDGCSSTLTQSGGVYTLAITNIPLLATKQGYVRITATRVGVTITKDFRFLKVQQGQDGAPGASAYSMILSNESHTLPAKADGTVTSFAGAACTATVYLGVAPDTGWSFAGSPASSGTLTYTQSGGTFTITGMDAGTDAAYIDITASKSGQSSITRRFSLAKSKSGKSVSIAATALTRTKTAAGILSPYQIVLTATGVGTSGTTQWYWWYEDETPFTATLLPISTGASSIRLNVDRTDFDVDDNHPSPAESPISGAWSTGKTNISIGVELDGVRDFVTLTQVSDGATGPTGANGADGTRGSRQILVTTATGAWDDTTAWNGIVSQTGTNPVPSDLVTIAKTDGSVATSKFYVSGAYPGTWQTPTAYINGSLLVTGTVGANQLAAGSVTTNKLTVGSGGNWLAGSGPTSGSETAYWNLGYNDTGLTATKSAGLPGEYPTGGASVKVSVTGTPASGKMISLDNANMYPVIAGQKYEISAYLSGGSLSVARVILSFFDASGTYISATDSANVAVPAASNNLANWARAASIITAPANATQVYVIARGFCNGGANPKLCVTQAYFGKAGPNQTEFSDWSPSGVLTQIDGSGIKTATITADRLVAGTIGANQLAAGSVTTDKLAVGSGGNWLAGSGPTSGSETAYWNLGYNDTGLTATKSAGLPGEYPTGGASVKVSVTGTPASGKMISLDNANMYPVIAGQKYEISAYLSGGSLSVARVILSFFDASGTYISATDSANVVIPVASSTLANWARAAAIITAPANATQVYVIARGVCNGDANPKLCLTQAYFGKAGPNQTEFSDWSPSGVLTQIDGSGIKTATITADRLVAGTITAASGVIGSLDASKITTGTLSANYISGGTINGSNVTVTNLNATNITGGTLSVDRISANSISGSKITIGGIETGNLAAGAVTWIDSKGRVRASPLSQTTTSGAEIEIAQSTAPANSNRGSILITCLLDVASPSYGAAPTQACNLFIYRGGTLLDYQGIYVVSQYYHQMALSFVDTSAPTSATTYYFKWKWTTGASGCLVAGSITLMELKR